LFSLPITVYVLLIPVTGGIDPVYQKEKEKKLTYLRVWREIN